MEVVVDVVEVVEVVVVIILSVRGLTGSGVVKGIITGSTVRVVGRTNAGGGGVVGTYG